jgi:hypothetical protein
MPELANFFILAWVVFVVCVWFWVRKNKPHLIGLGKDINKQRLDGVKFTLCKSCENGHLGPCFKWWQYAFIISTPIGFLLIGRPYKYVCDNCSTDYPPQKEFKLFTRLSLTHKLSKPFYVGFAVNIFIGLLVISLFLWNK